VVHAAVAPADGPGPLLTHHVWVRLAERLQPWERGGTVLRVSGYIKAHPTGRHAVRILKLDSRRGTWAASNGDEVWCIIEDGRVLTVMLRRSNQSRAATAFSVDRVHLSV
jgi:hypothetical protein